MIPETKSKQQLVTEYLSADTPHDWLVSEIEEYLFPDQGDDVDMDTLQEVFDRLETEAETVNANAYHADDLAVYLISTIRPDGINARFSTASRPTPMLLLEWCIDQCAVGAPVTIQQIYGDGRKDEHRLTWPFSMADAVTVTSPRDNSIETGVQRLTVRITLPNIEDLKAKYEQLQPAARGLSLVSLGAIGALLLRRKPSR